MDFNFEKEIKIIEKYYRHLQSQDTILRDIRSTRIIHGGGFRYDNGEKELISPIKEVASNVIFKYDEIRDFDLESFCNNLYEIVKQRIDTLHELMYSQLLNITELTGNRVDAGGSKFNPELLLDLLEKIQIRFDDNGEPILPQLHVGTKLFNEIKEMSYTPSQIRRKEEIIEKKRDEWYAKKRYRKLSFID